MLEVYENNIDIINVRIDNEKQKDIWNNFIIMVTLIGIDYYGSEDSNNSNNSNNETKFNYILYSFNNIRADKYKTIDMYVMIEHGIITSIEICDYDKDEKVIFASDIDKEEDLKELLDKMISILK